MNVPVLCLEGQNHSGRVGYSILKNLGLEELISTSKEEYINHALNFAKNKNELSKFNNGLREVLINSDLCNAKIFAKKFENLIENILINHK